MSPIGSGVPHLDWHKSTYSQGLEQCVEIADNIPSRIPIRDSKRSHMITAQPESWVAFIAALRASTLSG
ncbi:DUF397 domain-containing protein [Streptomyces sp. AV19]|uniref:DUF397 domain-containing protein n=1 Tax=Streptomyces sp. AV19 TaxID=2793068 RepID=UPI0018FED634|nr:DUF397 domain-containing protein [Streptomyces sp. AV19]MBH1938540.1 DUF397 domain-containing protein [Streptomyces sp. AV19]MDG4535189.1 DUF397 domain-containing protein [Streptomyces sp. AV19]